MAATFRAGDTEEAVWLMGRYADEYRFEDGRWKFSRVALDAQTLTPYEHGWAEVPFREG
jgi:hypothetical protein